MQQNKALLAVKSLSEVKTLPEAKTLSADKTFQPQENPECYENLANAIVLQAFKDYKRALWRLSQNPYDSIAAGNKKKLDRFFDSNWYRLLTDVNADILVGEAKRQVEDRYEKQQRAIQRSRARRAAFAM